MTVSTIVFDSPDYWAAVDLRRRVLREPLGLEFDPADLAREGSDIHLAAFDGDRMVGCLMLSTGSDGALKMRQVAVEPTRQGSGIGRAMVEASERVARERGARFIVLHARETAVPFYRALSYATEGELFLEVGIPHLKMSKPL